MASSGNPDVATFGNTYQGFSQALAHLRDLYAPDVVLGFHVSCWASLQDICSSTDPGLDVSGAAATVATFADKAGVVDVPPGVHPYDLVFTDVADRDAGVSSNLVGQPQCHSAELPPVGVLHVGYHLRHG